MSNKLENIKAEEIFGMYLMGDENNLPCLAVVANNRLVMQQLHDGFGIHYSNEFLCSLNLGCEISFVNFKQYQNEIHSCNTLLAIRRIIDETNVDVSPVQIRRIMLDDNDDFGFNAIQAAKDDDALSEYVHMAIAIYCKGRTAKAV